MFKSIVSIESMKNAKNQHTYIITRYTDQSMMIKIYKENMMNHIRTIYA